MQMRKLGLVVLMGLVFTLQGVGVFPHLSNLLSRSHVPEPDGIMCACRHKRLASRSERQADNAGAGKELLRLPGFVDPDDAASSFEGSRNIEPARFVECDRHGIDHITFTGHKFGTKPLRSMMNWIRTCPRLPMCALSGITASQLRLTEAST